MNARRRTAARARLAVLLIAIALPLACIVAGISPALREPVSLTALLTTMTVSSWLRR